MDIQMDSNMRGVIAAICLSSIVNMGGTYVTNKENSASQAIQAKVTREDVESNSHKIIKIAETLETLNITLARMQAIMEINSRERYYGNRERKRESDDIRFPYSPNEPSGWATKSGNRGRN